MLLSVVIPAYNAEPYIAAQLEALAHQLDAGPFEVLVVDNVSSDRTAEVAAAYADRLDLHVIKAARSRSAAYARNVGVAAASGEVIIFVDADDVADESLVAAYRRRTDVYRIMGGHYEESKLNDPRVAAWRYGLTNGGLPLAFRTVRFFLMGNAAIHRSVFDEIGRFDEGLIHGGEEVEFAARAYIAGYEIGWVPDAIVYYRHRTSLRGLARQFFDYGRATTYVYALHRERAKLPRTTFEDTLGAARSVIPHVIDLGLGSSRRGQWLRLSSFYAGEIYESVRRRTWHLG